VYALDSVDAIDDQGFDVFRASALRCASLRTSAATTASRALFSGTGRFHGSVEGQQIGLEGNAIDDAVISAIFLLLWLISASRLRLC